MPINNTGGRGIWPQGIRYSNNPTKSESARPNINPHFPPLSVTAEPAVENTHTHPSLQEKEAVPNQPENPITARGVAPAPENGEMTDSLGRPVPNDTNSLTVGSTGPTLLEDIHFIDKLSHFDRERIPERVVHAKGAGAFGSFICYESMAAYTMADFLNRKGKQTPVFVRFSTVIGGRGSADTVRDPRGFAVKFYTNEGIYDLVGNDLPVFFIRDAIKFPDVIHSLKPSPDSNMSDSQRFWDFVSLTPEATHMITWLYSDRGTIRDYRNIDGFGVNTYVWVNRNSERLFVKFHWKTMQGLETIDRHEAARLAGSNPDVAVMSLHEAIARGDYPKYELCVQLMKSEDADALPFDPLDDTKVWPEDAYPLKKVGMMTLNRNPENFFAQVEQAAFCPGNIVPGIEFSADKMLQGRAFSYLDTQRHRIGPNFMQLPVNRSLNQPYNNQRDGSMTYKFNPSPINYSPNSLNGNRPLPAAIPVPKPVHLSGEAVRQQIPKTDDFTQAGEHFRSLDKMQREHLVDNIAVELWKCRPDIIRRVTGYFENADHSFGAEVTRAMDAYRKAG